MMFKPKRLHPTAIIFTIISAIKSGILGLLPLAIILIREGTIKLVLIGLGVLLLLFTIASFLHWLRFTYSIVDDEIRIEQGVFIRKKRYISKNRIQSIDLTQGIIHRIFGLTKLQIETAGSDKDVDASLSSITMQEGEMIRDYLKAKTVEQEELITDFTEYPKEEVTTKRLVIAGSTSGSLGVIAGLFGFLFSQMESIIPETFYNQAYSFFISLAIEAIVILILIIVIILWALGILGTVIKYGRFTITRYDDELYITRGLLEKKQMTIPLKRIQAIGIKESIIRQPFGFATIYVEIAGGEVKENSDSTTLLFPIIKRTEIQAFLEKIVPEYATLPETFNYVPKRSLPYYLIRSLITPIIALIAVAIFFPDWYLIPAAICGIAVMIGLAKHQTASFAINEGENQLTLRFRPFLSKDTVIISKNRIQALTKSEHFLHRKQNLATFELSILNNMFGRNFSMMDFNEQDIHHLTNWYSRVK